MFGFFFCVILGNPQWVAGVEGIYVHDIEIDPTNRKVIYIATDNQGVLKSIDGGKNWNLVNKGIQSYLLYDLKIHPKKPDTVYVASWGGGLYQSKNEGQIWEEQNNGLGDTAIWRIFLSPERRDQIYILTSSGVYTRKGKINSWELLDGGLSLGDEEIPQSFFVLPGASPILFLGTDQGIYRWESSNQKWEKISLAVPLNVTEIAYRLKDSELFFGTMNEGLFRSPDLGKTFQLVKGTKGIWINRVIFHPDDPNTFFILTRSKGILKTTDEGSSWATLNEGISDSWVTALAFDPKNSNIFYAGTHEHGIFKSVDGGKKWKSILEKAIQAPEKRNTDLLPKDPVGQKKKILPPPESFKKCNECHGWTDPKLDFHSPTYYRMVANPRDWSATVKRMSKRAQLSLEEEKEIILYLNSYYGIKK